MVGFLKPNNAIDEQSSMVVGESPGLSIYLLSISFLLSLGSFFCWVLENQTPILKSKTYRKMATNTH